MARVTRSIQREIEQHTQSNLDPSIPSFQPIRRDVVLPGLDRPMRHVLGEMAANGERQAASVTPKAPTGVESQAANEEQAVPVPPKDATEVELKGLKAAFRTAIGVKKKKKPKKFKANSSQDTKVDGQPMATVDEETAYYLQEHIGGGARNLPIDTMQQEFIIPNPEVAINGLSSDTVRMTRHQLAKQQSGQSESTISSWSDSGSYPGAYHPSIRSVSSQIISQITDGQFEIFRNLEIANYSIILANEKRRELEGIINIPEVRAHLQRQPPIQTNDDIFVERDVKMLSPIDDKIPTMEVPKKDVQKPTVEKVIEGDEDSFVQAITSRSPAKPVSRVDDYVDELDKLEDVMEALDEATSPNPKVTSPCKATFLNGKRGSLLDTEHASRIISPTDVELAKLRTGKADKNKIVATTKADGYRSLRVKSKDGLLHADLAVPKHTLRKAKSTSFETNARKVSDQSTRTSSRSSTRLGVSKRPVTAPSSQNIRDISRASSRSEKRHPIATTSTKRSTMLSNPSTRLTSELPREAMARKLKEQREARRSQYGSEDTVSQAGSTGPKIKSAKAPTKPAFELPGEAISRRKREAHEARLKKAEEEEKKRREFKAKPSKTSFVPSAAVRETASSRARQSLVAQSHVIPTNVDAVKQMDSIQVSKRGATGGSETTMSSRPAFLPSDSNPSISNSRPPAAALTHRNLTPHTSIVGTARPAPFARPPKPMTGLSTPKSTLVRKVSDNKRGKEIYQRQEKQLAEMQREKKEKEDVARRVREEAAERGRQASREWAEKQKEKERLKAGKSDVVLGPGFGPGGQLGLKA